MLRGKLLITCRTASTELYKFRSVFNRQLANLNKKTDVQTEFPNFVGVIYAKTVNLKQLRLCNHKSVTLSIN